MSDPVSPYTDAQLDSDEVSKKDICIFLQENSARKFLKEHKLFGQLKSIVKTKSKDQLKECYQALFEQKAFKREGDEEEESVESVTKATEKLTVKAKAKEIIEEPKFTKHVLKKGDKINFPSKGSEVECLYTGKLDDGTIFDSNEINLKRGKKIQPLRFKVGTGKVIKGWDQAVLTMSAGERSTLVIEPEWAYGKKGMEGKIPPNSRLTFELELTRIY